MAGRHAAGGQPSQFAQQRTAARKAAQTKHRATLAKKAAGVTPEGAAVYAAGAVAGSARDAGRARLPTGNRQYQGVIVAEFLVAVLITGLAPLARGKGAEDSSSGPSPYGPDDIKQLAGIGAVYFVLALLSSGKHGRLSAWFGGLVLIGIGLSQTVSGGLPAIFGIFQPSALSSGGSAGSTGASAGSSAAAVPATGGTPLPIPDATGIFPVITPSGQTVPAGVTAPTPSGSPSFNQQVTQAATGSLVAAYTGGPGVVTTNTGTQLA
jgi:hypothetical protein